MPEGPFFQIRCHIVLSSSCQCGDFESAAHFSSTAQSIQMKGKHIYQTTSEPTQLKTFYLDVKLLQSKAINHSFYKFKIVLLILEEFPNSVRHNYTSVTVHNGRSSVTSQFNMYIHVSIILSWKIVLNHGQTHYYRSICTSSHSGQDTLFSYDVAHLVALLDMV